MKSPNDTLTVHNIDVDCEDEHSEFFRKIDSTTDEDGNHVTIENDIPYEFNHRDGFETLYGGNIFRVKPGDTRRLPRYVAEKFAKELIDHMAMKETKKTGDNNLINDIKYRTKMLEQVIIDEEILVGDSVFDKPQNNFNVVDDKNNSTVLKEEEIEVPDSLRGFEVKDQPTITAQDVKEAPHEEIKDGDKTRTRAELMSECKQLGLPVSRTDTTRDLLNRIKAF